MAWDYREIRECRVGGVVTWGENLKKSLVDILEKVILAKGKLSMALISSTQSLSRSADKLSGTFVFYITSSQGLDYNHKY